MQYYCMFCNMQEKGYQPQCDYICSGCVQLLCGADQEDLKRAHAKATKLGLSRKVEALESFIEEESDEQRNNPRKLERDNDRARTLRTVRDQKEQIERFAV
jgi:hypothetical protein